VTTLGLSLALLFAVPAPGTVKSSDGVEIRYEVQGSGSPPIAFVHGWSCDKTYWRAQTEHFAKSHHVVAIDLGGHGESGRTRKNWTVASFGADVAAVLEALDLRGAVLVGHSMGGPVILEAYRLAPDRIAALIPVDTLFDVGAPATPEDRDSFLSPMRKDFRAGTDAFVRRFMFTPLSDAQLIDRIAADMASAPPEVGLSALESLFDYDEGGGLQAVKVPLRLLNSDSFFTNLDAARRHKKDVSLAVMPGVGHFLMVEDPEEFNRLLARAVRDLTAPFRN
jgi:pimeloyl-ACP methyl ester carboxylesterase